MHVEREILDSIRKLSSEGIANVISESQDMNILGHSMPRKDLEQLAQHMVNECDLDEILFIIELDSE